MWFCFSLLLWSTFQYRTYSCWAYGHDCKLEQNSPPVMGLFTSLFLIFQTRLDSSDTNGIENQLRHFQVIHVIILCFFKTNPVGQVCTEPLPASTWPLDNVERLVQATPENPFGSSNCQVAPLPIFSSTFASQDLMWLYDFMLSCFAHKGLKKSPRFSGRGVLLSTSFLIYLNIYIYVYICIYIYHNKYSRKPFGKKWDGTMERMASKNWIFGFGRNMLWPWTDRCGLWHAFGFCSLVAGSDLRSRQF